MKKVLIVAFLFYLIPIQAQKEYSYVYSNDSIIKRGIALYEKQNYSDAIKEYDRIGKVDPEYYTAQYEKLLALTTSGKKDEAKTLFEQLYKDNKMPEAPNLFMLYGSFLSDEKKYDEAEKVFKEGEKYTPNSTNLLYNKAILYLRLEQRQKCIDVLERIITINPNSASSHYLLGIIAFEDGKIVEGTLALLSYLAIAPTGSHFNDAILKLNAKYGENYLDKGKLVFSKSGDNFEEIETILRNQLPLKKAYKVNSEIDDVIIRQIQAIADYSLEHKMEKGFFETNYMPWIKNVMEQKQFEGLSYYILLGLEDKLGKKLTSQKKKINDFYTNYYSTIFWNHFAKRKLEHFGKEEEVVISTENNIPSLIGAIIDNKKEGKYKLLDEYGNISGELNTENDQLQGLQKYFDKKGNITVEKNFTKGKADGKRTVYYSNGQISLIENYKDDLLNGLSTSYYVNGGKQCESNFVDGERDGKFICLYPNSSKKLEIEYIKGKINGKYISYNKAGDIEEMYNYTNDELDGKYVAYFDGKIIKKEANYVNGKAQGSYKSYFNNGALEKEMIYENGKIKKSFDYYANGKIDTESVFDEKEELELFRLFDSNGEIYFDEKFKSGELKSGLQYSRTNPKPTEINLTKKAFVINDLNGKTQISGNFEKGRKTGEWIYYYTSGTMKNKSNFKLGKQEGLFHTYDKNGLLSSIVNYNNDTISGINEVYRYNRLSGVYNYSKGKIEGPYTIFNPDGSLLTEGYFVNDEVVGDRYTYWQNGVISRKEKFIDNIITYVENYNQKGEKENTLDYKNKSGVVSQKRNDVVTHTFELINGELNGKYTIKDKNNAPVLEAEFVNGDRSNTYKIYSPLGTISYEAPYYSGLQHGIEKTYDLVGNLRLTNEYLFGEEYGKSIRYYQNKSKIFEYNQLNSNIEGEYKYYNQAGELILIIGFQNNNVQYYIKKNKTGELTDKVTIENETADITSNYPNGKPAIHLKLVKGIKQDKFAIYNSNGKPEYEAMYKNDLLNGSRIEYYSNGNIYKKELFVNNDYEGVQEYYKEDGKPWLKATYKNDELQGPTTIYTNGIITLTKKYNSDDLVEISK